MTDYRALCSELIQQLQELHTMVWGEAPHLLDEDSGGSAYLDLDIEDVLDRARAALAEQPVVPTDDELDEYALFWWGSDTDERTVTDVIECCSMTAYARAVLARWGTSNLAEVRSSLGDHQLLVEDDVDLYLEQ
jgi:hypothetical protein